MQEFLEIQRQADSQGKSVTQVLEENIQAEVKRLGDEAVENVRVQIMPHNVVGGKGKFPAIVMMTKEKAVDLAQSGIVKILLNDSDVVGEDNAEAIAEHVDDMMAARKPVVRIAGQVPKQRIARFTNVTPFLKLEEEDKKRKEQQQSKETPAAQVGGEEKSSGTQRKTA